MGEATLSAEAERYSFLSWEPVMGTIVQIETRHHLARFVADNKEVKSKFTILTFDEWLSLHLIFININIHLMFINICKTLACKYDRMFYSFYSYKHTLFIF